MENFKITEKEINDNNVKNAPDTVRADTGSGYTARDVKNIFDRLPELIAKKFNAFVEWTGNSMLTTEQLQTAVNEALEEAKASGEFDGTSVTITDVAENTNDGGTNLVLFSDGTVLSIKNGNKGSAGTSATHSWNGTILTIKSASGESSADLKGEKGDDGEDGLSVYYYNFDLDAGYHAIVISDIDTFGRTIVAGDFVISRNGFLFKVDRKNATSANLTYCADLNGPEGKKGADGFSIYKAIAEPFYNEEADNYGIIREKVETEGRTVQVSDFVLTPEGKMYSVISTMDSRTYMLKLYVELGSGGTGGGGTDGKDGLSVYKCVTEPVYVAGRDYYYIAATDVDTAGRTAQEDESVIAPSGKMFTITGFGPNTITLKLYTSFKAEFTEADKAELTEDVAQKLVEDGTIPTKTSQLDNDSNFAKKGDIPQSLPASDVYNWAKQPSKPSYTKSEVGLGNVDNVKQYSASNPPPYPVSSVNGRTGAVEVEEKGTAQTKVTNHNADDEAHNDIRLLISALTKKVNDLLDSDDTTLDQMSEVVAYIKANRELLESYTTEKVNVADIIDNLTTSVSNKPLSAKQGVQLKALIDAIKAPTKVSALENDAGYMKSSEQQTVINNALAQAKASGDFDGEDGTSVTVSNVTTSTADGGSNVVTFSDGKTLTIKNGSKGSTGAKGADGYTPQKGIDYSDGKDGKDGKTPVRGTDYWTAEDKQTIVAEVQATATQLEPLYAESLEWLAENGDTSKVYILPDGFIYAYMLTEKEVSSGGGYTNLIDGTNGYIKAGYRYSASSSAFKADTSNPDAAAIIIPIPTSGTITIRVRGMKYHAGYPTVYGGTTNANFSNCFNDSVTTKNTYDENGDWYFTFENTKGVSYIVTSGLLVNGSTNVIATVNEPIVEGGTEIVTEYDWANTGHAFVPADYEEIITEHTAKIADHEAEIEALKAVVESGTSATDDEKLTRIRNWDIPIYDKADVFLCSADKESATNWAMTPADIYSRYDALMNANPNFITKTDLGLSSDGMNHVYRYDFKEAEPHHQNGFTWSETKPKAIIISGIHYEWGGIYALYNALCEITTNPQLAELRRNVHLIVIPCCNPYATIANNYQSGLATPNSYGVRNANGVEIHRNFEVDWVLTESGTTHYGGTKPLSEVETQYIDNIMKNNKDAVFFMSCHSCQTDTTWGTNFIWASTATKYMCNMGYRVIDKLSNAWLDKYGDTLLQGIENNKTDALADGDTRLGWAQLSNTAGSEQKQATKYGIQAFNVEITDTMSVLDSTALSAKAMTHGAEVYANFIKTVFSCYDYKDKAEYYK